VFLLTFVVVLPIILAGLWIVAVLLGIDPGTGGGRD
jgi:hypothetical protein